MRGVVHWPAKPVGAALLEMNGRTVPLQRERVASGFGYGDGGTYIRGEGKKPLLPGAACLLRKLRGALSGHFSWPACT
jgi:hypothetical protein